MEKPIKKFNRWRRITGCYNITDPKEESAQYIFYLRPDAPERLWKGFSIGFDWEPSVYSADTPAIDVVIELIEGYEKYLYTGSLDKAKELLTYLESVENEDYLDKLMYDLDYAAYKVDFWTDRLHKAEKELERKK